MTAPIAEAQLAGTVLLNHVTFQTGAPAPALNEAQSAAGTEREALGIA